MENTQYALHQESRLVPPRVLIAYHKNCIDGFMSAYIVRQAVSEKNMYAKAEVKCLPMAYENKDDIQELINELWEGRYAVLYVVDFSIDKILLESFLSQELVSRIYVYDHHLSAFDKYCPKYYATHQFPEYFNHTRGLEVSLDLNECGASLCYEEMYGDCIEAATIKNALALLVEYIKDYDIWTFKKGKDTHYMHEYLHLSTPWTFDKIDNIVAELTLSGYEHLSIMLEVGAKEYRNKLTKINELEKKARRVVLAGIAGLGVVAPAIYASELGNRLANTGGTFGLVIPPVAPADYDPSGKITVSLRSVGDFSVFAMASGYEGGGHKNAAGCSIPREELLEFTDAELQYGA
jgi:oligoribonuclease NrnB/cAMP/cGMP phosphodiesterase (DHH superfamily)